jgi:aldose sugar dehydrogenase
MIEMVTLLVLKSADQNLQLQSIYKGEEVVWGFDFPSRDKIVFTERSGKMKLYDFKNNALSEVTGLPAVVAEGQGGLMDVALHPDYQKNSLIYFTYSVKLEDGYTTRLSRAQLKDNMLINNQILFTASPGGDSSMHFGSRIAFDGQGHVFISVGERNERDKAQDLNTHHGKVIRLNEDGSIPKDNPYLGQKNARPEVFSFGHRNPQGLYWDSSAKQLYLSEHGPRGGDEINLVKAKTNYGWPNHTYGREYWGPKIGNGPTAIGVEPPIKYYIPSIAPSSLTQYRGSKLKKWDGHWFLGALKLTHLNRIVIKNGKAISEERLLENWGKRIRFVRTGPDQLLYLSTDDGYIARIAPQ